MLYFRTRLWAREMFSTVVGGWSHLINVLPFVFLAAGTSILVRRPKEDSVFKVTCCWAWMERIMQILAVSYRDGDCVTCRHYWETDAVWV